MGNDFKSGFGYIIPAAALIGFVVALIAEQFLLSVFFAAGGILVWFIYMQVMETTPPSVMGNFIILFSILIATGLFLAFGLKMNPHGGYEIIPEGSILSFVILFFGILAGILFNRSRIFEQKDQLTEAEKKAVEESLNQKNTSGESPKIVVIKSEQAKENKDKDPETPPSYYQNPYYYPEDYDYEDDDEYEDEYEDDDEYEDEYEDEYDDYEDEYEDEEGEERSR